MKWTRNSQRIKYKCTLSMGDNSTLLPTSEIQIKITFCPVRMAFTKKNQLTTHAGVYAREGIIHSAVKN